MKNFSVAIILMTFIAGCSVVCPADFSLLDTNNDGKAGLGEFRKACPDVDDKLFILADKDRDAFLSPEEWESIAEE